MPKWNSSKRWKSTRSADKFTPTTFPTPNYWKMFEISACDQGSATSLLEDFPAPVPAKPEQRQDCTTTPPDFGLNFFDLSANVGQLLWRSKILKALLIAACEQSLADCEWQDIERKLKLSRQREAERRTAAIESSSLPTPTTYPQSSNGSPAGQNKLHSRLKPTPQGRDSRGASGKNYENQNLPRELLATPTANDCSPCGQNSEQSSLPKDLKNLDFIQKGQQMNPEVPAWMMGFPAGWATQPLLGGGAKINPPQKPASKKTKSRQASADLPFPHTGLQSAPSKQNKSGIEFGFSGAPCTRQGMIIAFSETIEGILSKQKKVTRRAWTDKHAAKFLKAWDEGRHIHQAWDKSPTAKGKFIASIKLTQRPYQERLADMPESDVAIECVPGVATKDQFISLPLFSGKDQVVWVVRFEVV